MKTVLLIGYAFSQIFDRRDVTYLLADYKGAEPCQPVPANWLMNYLIDAKNAHLKSGYSLVLCLVP